MEAAEIVNCASCDLPKREGEKEKEFWKYREQDNDKVTKKKKPSILKVTNKSYKVGINKEIM